MASSFVPLIPPTGTMMPTAAFKLKVISSEKPTLDAGSSLPETNPLENHNQCRDAKPEVTFHKEGDTITKIRIVCPCGQVIELGCQY
jgi:hypothetical protein